MSACDRLKQLGFEVSSCITPSLPLVESGRRVPVLEAQGYLQPTFSTISADEHPYFWVVTTTCFILLLLIGMVLNKHCPTCNVVTHILRLLELRRNRILQQQFVPANSTFSSKVVVEELETGALPECTIIEIPESD